MAWCFDQHQRGHVLKHRCKSRMIRLVDEPQGEMAPVSAGFKQSVCAAIAIMWGDHEVFGLELAEQQVNGRHAARRDDRTCRSEEHTSELQSLMHISYAVLCLKKKKKSTRNTIILMRH